jgi:hypothetical protein
MKKNITLALAAITIVFMSFDVMDHDGIAGYSGSPAEKNCTNCHSTFALNSGGGSVAIASPTLTNWSYVPGQTYTINVTVAKTGVKLFGLEFEALTSAGANAGTLTAGTGTVIKSATVSGNSRASVTHALNGGKGTDSHIFSFTWKAPATDVGKITFYCAGNAANGDDKSIGDYIYTTSQVVTSPSTVGIAEQVAFSRNISIYPNPATDQLQIVNASSPSEHMNISIIDLKGSLISAKENVRSNEAIEVSNLNPGLYSLRIESAGKIAVKPFIKQ